MQDIGEIINRKTGGDFWPNLHAAHDRLNAFGLLFRDFRITDKVEILRGEYKQDDIEGVCRFHDGEPETHRDAKYKIFQKFTGKTDYLILTEIDSKYKDGVPVFDKGTRKYRFDILVINYVLYKKLYDCINTHSVKKFNDLDGQAHRDLQEITTNKHRIIFCVELDGDHSDKKDALRDKFFLDTYGVATARYEVSEMTNTFYKKYRGKIANKKHMNNFTKTPNNEAYLDKLTKEDIEDDVRANYKLKSKTT